MGLTGWIQSCSDEVNGVRIVVKVGHAICALCFVGGCVHCKYTEEGPQLEPPIVNRDAMPEINVLTNQTLGIVMRLTNYECDYNVIT